MTIKVKGPHSGPKESVLAFARARGSTRYDEVIKFVNQLYAQNIFDAFMICAQSANETSNWTDDAWTTRLNPAGIGIMDDQDLQYGFASGADGAKAVLIHHSAYTGTPIPNEWSTWKELDPRYQAVFDKGFNGKITNWEDYGDGYWATDPYYFEAISERAQAMHSFDDGGSMYTPKIIDKYLDVDQDGWDAVYHYIHNRGGMSPKIIVLHIQEGHNWGSWEWFHQTTASSTVMIGPTGEIWRVVQEQHGPWTNGDVNAPTSLGRSILNRFGSDPNYYTLSIETDGFTGEWPKPQAQLDAVVWQVKTWMKRYNIPLDLVVRHADFNQVDRPYCPGNAYYNYIISRIKNEGTDVIIPPADYAKPNPVIVSGKNWDGLKDVTVNNVLFHAEKRLVTASQEGAVRVYATVDSPMTRDPLKTGEKYNVLGWVSGEEVDGERRWWIMKNYSRVWVGNTGEKPKAPSPTGGDDKPDKLPAGVKILNGRVYYPARSGGKPRRIVAIRDTNLRKSATTKSEVLGKAEKGDEFDAYYWTFGDPVRNERVWWVVKRGQTDTLTQGYRISANATNVRPS